MRISDWSSDVCSSDLELNAPFDGFVSIAADQKTLTLKEIRGGRTQTLTGFDDLLVGDGDLVFQNDPLARKRGWVAELGRASVRGRGCQYCENSVVAV